MPVASGYRLEIGDGAVPQMSVVRSPYLTLEAVIFGAAAAVAGTADGLSNTVQQALPYEAGFALAPMIAAIRRGEEEVVDAFMPVQPHRDVSIQTQIEHMRNAPDELLLGDLRRLYGDDLPRSWQPAADRPRAWFDSLARATAHGFTAIQPTWRTASPAIDREIERVGVALVRGGYDVVLNSLHPGVRYSDGVLTLAADTNRSVRLDGRRLALVPLIGCSRTLLANFDLPDLAYIAYRVPWRRAIGHDDSDDALAVVLGPLRARALRHLSQPMTAGALARALDCGPTKATYHCKQLESARLIVRERRGQSVWISRTPRGHELIDLMA